MKKRKGDLVIAGLAVQWVIIDLLLPVGRQYLEYLYHMGTWQFQGTDYTSIYPFTYATALALFFFALFSFRFRFRLDWFRTVLFSVSLPFAATSLFEEIYQNLGFALHVQYIAPPFDAHLINISSILFGLVSVNYWRVTKAFYAMLMGFTFLWCLWVAAGYPQIYGSSDLVFAYSVNILLKVLSYALFGVLVEGGLSAASFKGRRGKSQEEEKDTQLRNESESNLEHSTMRE